MNFGSAFKRVTYNSRNGENLGVTFRKEFHTEGVLLNVIPHQAVKFKSWYFMAGSSIRSLVVDDAKRWDDQLPPWLHSNVWLNDLVWAYMA